MTRPIAHAPTAAAPHPVAAAAPPDWLSPRADPGRFVLRRQLGGGSMGAVYAAFDRRIRRRIALKAPARDEPWLLTHLQDEFRQVRGVRHPNVVRLHDLFQGDRAWFFTMELVRGHRYLTWVRGQPAGRTAEPGPNSTTASQPRSIVSAEPGAPATAAVIDRLWHTLPQLGSALASS